MKNPYKHIKKKIDDFMDSTYDFNRNETIAIISLFVLFIAISIVLPLLISTTASKVSFLYLSFVFTSFIMAANNETEWMFTVSGYLAVPYIFMVMLSVTIVRYFVPYKGDDPMKLRYYKLQTLKRKAKINKLKFWK